MGSASGVTDVSDVSTAGGDSDVVDEACVERNGQRAEFISHR